jgi:Xaa-Pro aminopeptidase
MTPRIKKLIAEFPRHKNIDALLVTNDTNIHYLTDFKAHESWLLIIKPKTETAKAFYITDFRYTQEAKEGLKGVAVKQYCQTPCVEVFDLCKKYKVKRLGFDEKFTTLAMFKRLKEFCPRHRKLVPATGIVEGLREIKEEGEISQIRQCLEVHYRGLDFLRKVVQPGLTEAEILHKLEGFAKKEGVGFSFPPIIASGPNSAYPHAKVTNRTIRNNEPVLLDTGIDINGYKSDLTRNFFLGRIPPSYAKALTAVRLAQKEAITMIKPGVAVADVDQKARNVLRKFGLAKYFGHSLGHGVGLDIHENPRLSCKSNALLEPGMIVTVEPGVYIPGEFGIRVEDMVLVTEQGCEVLSGNYDQ